MLRANINFRAHNYNEPEDAKISG